MSEEARELVKDLFVIANVMEEDEGGVDNNGGGKNNSNSGKSKDKGGKKGDSKSNAEDEDEFENINA